MRLVIILALFISLIACKSSHQEKILVTGNFKNLQVLGPEIIKDGKVTIYLFEIPFGLDAQPIQIDSIILPVTESKFQLKGLTKGEGMYDIVIDRGGPMIPLINDVEELVVDADFTIKDNFYKVSGSPASEYLYNFIGEYSKRGNDINIALTQLDSLKKINASDSIQIVATENKNQKIASLNQFVKESIQQANHPAVATFVLGRASQTLSLTDFETALKGLSARFTDDKNVLQIKKQFDTYKLQSAAEEKKKLESGLIGKPAPELELPDVNGKMVKLSSFKGKYVLVDFWASWCGPCRNENPNVVAAYQKFKNKNFTIVGVSLDKNKDEWLQAIQEDGLTWTHISDLAYWKSIAVPLYDFDGIPYNVLIDPNGIIIADGLRGNALQEKLTELLK